MRFRILLTALAVCAAAVPAAAQTFDAPRFAAPAAAQAGGGSTPGLRVYGLYDYVSLTARDSFDAIFDSSNISGLGVGVEGIDLWRGFFARFAYTRMTRTGGTRAFVINGQVIPTGVGLEVEMSPIEFGGGWRQSLDGIGRYVAYGGVSGLRMAYKETSEFAQSGDEVDETFNGLAVFAGLDAMVARSVFLGAEVQYRRVPDAIGFDGVSQAFGEDDLGGVVFRVLFGIRR